MIMRDHKLPGINGYPEGINEHVTSSAIQIRKDLIDK